MADSRVTQSFTGLTIPKHWLAKLLELIEKNVRFYYGSEWSYASKRLELSDPEMVIRLQRVGCRITAAVAYKMCYEETVRVCYIYELHVCEKARGNGMGSRLLKEVEAIAREAGVNGLMLTVHTRNSDAVKFYSHRGFERSPISPSLCAPPAMSRVCGYDVMQLIWDQQSLETLRRRGEAAKVLLKHKRTEPSIPRVRLKMSSGEKRAYDLRDWFAPSKRKR